MSLGMEEAEDAETCGVGEAELEGKVCSQEARPTHTSRTTLKITLFLSREE